MDKLYKINYSYYILDQTIGKWNDSKVNYKQITNNRKIFLPSVRRDNFDKPLNNI